MRPRVAPPEGCPSELLHGDFDNHHSRRSEAPFPSLAPPNQPRHGITRLAEFAQPDRADLDVLTMIDLTVSPTGEPIRDVDRIAEILRRYKDGDPVFRAVTRSRPSLLAASTRSKALLNLAPSWPLEQQ